MDDTRNFLVIDAMPGSGKTEYFVRRAKHHLTATPNSILVYVAPTVQLLAETYKRVCAVVPKEALRLVIPVVHDRQRFRTYSGEDTPSYTVCNDQPSTAINYLLGLISSTDYQKVRYRGNKGFSKSFLRGNPVTAGTVIFTTHETFSRVSSRDYTNRDFRVLKNTDVVFDEARHCVMRDQRLVLNDSDAKAFWAAVDYDRVHQYSPSKKDGGLHWYLNKITMMGTLDRLLKIFEANRASQLPAPVRALKKLVDTYVFGGRASLYILTRGDDYSKHPSSFYLILRPESLFSHYREVVLTSAFFEFSQMYHFLKKDGHTFTFLMKEPNPSPTVAAIKSRDRQLRDNLRTRLEVAPLIRTNEKISRKNLTSYLLSMGMLAPVQFEPKLIREPATTQTILADLLSGKQVSEDPHTQRTLRQFAVPPLWVLLAEAASIVRKHGKRSLLTLNSLSDRIWAPSQVRYLKVVRRIYADGSLRKTFGDEGAATERELSDMHGTPNEWQERLAKILALDRVFVIPSSPKLHGVNRFSHMESFTHLAALNPSPMLIRVYRGLLGSDYNVDQDHSIENLVQMLYRTSLRDPKATSKVLLIVPFVDSAKLLFQKVGVDTDPVIVHEPRLKRFSYSTAIATDVRRKITTLGGLATRKYEKSSKSALNNYRSKVSSARKRVAADPDNQRKRKTLERLEAELARLIEISKIKP